MDVPNKTLRQHRALLSARQGDRQLPASGTFFAHRQRLMTEMKQSLIEHGLMRSRQAARALNELARVKHSRSPADIANDLRTVDAEIAQIDERIEEIDRLLKASERPGYL